MSGLERMIQHHAAAAELLRQLRDQCAEMAEGYSYGYAAARAIRTISIERLMRAAQADAGAPASSNDQPKGNP